MRKRRTHNTECQNWVWTMEYGVWTDRRFTNIEREVRVTTILERDGTRYNCYSTEEQIKYHGRKVCSARTARTARTAYISVDNSNSPSKQLKAKPWLMLNDPFVCQINNN